METTESEKLRDGDKETERDRARTAKGKQRETRAVMWLDGKKDRKNIQKVETICACSRPKLMGRFGLLLMPN